jgi:hypothetical protein
MSGCSGSLVREEALWYTHAANPMVVEAFTIRDVVKLAMEINYNRTEIESDAQEVVKPMNGPGIDRSKNVTVLHRKLRS